MTQKWEKVLYKKQNVPDNYVDPTFLSDLHKNVNLYNYSWTEAFRGVFCVTHEISCTALFVVTFVFLKEDSFSIFSVISGISALTFLCSVLQQWLMKDWWILDVSSMQEYAKSCLIFLSFGCMTSPILKTLTESISTDTIHATASLTLLAHVIFQDYGTPAALVSATFSLNSALFAAVCLASRLPSVHHTFALVILAVQFFVLLPILRRKMKDNIPLTAVITLLYFVVTLGTLLYISLPHAVLLLLTCFGVNFLFPTLFVYCQKYKETIFGPWDEAVVKTE